jgi:hypothetical protein
MFEKQIAGMPRYSGLLTATCQRRKKTWGANHDIFRDPSFNSKRGKTDHFSLLERWLSDKNTRFDWCLRRVWWLTYLFLFRLISLNTWGTYCAFHIRKKIPCSRNEKKAVLILQHALCSRTNAKHGLRKHHIPRKVRGRFSIALKTI